MSSSSARIGVMPTPPAISTARRCLRRAAVKLPNGPSAKTRVPGRIRPTVAEESPSALTVMRSARPSGAAESE
jgi:hypothetical protein